MSFELKNIADGTEKIALYNEAAGNRYIFSQQIADLISAGGANLATANLTANGNYFHNWDNQNLNIQTIQNLSFGGAASGGSFSLQLLSVGVLSLNVQNANGGLDFVFNDNAGELEFDIAKGGDSIGLYGNPNGFYFGTRLTATFSNRSFFRINNRQSQHLFSSTGEWFFNTGDATPIVVLPPTDNALTQFLVIDTISGQWKLKDESSLVITSAGIGPFDQTVPTGVPLRVFSSTDAATNLDFTNFNDFSIILGGDYVLNSINSTITLSGTHTIAAGTTTIRTDSTGFNINTSGNDRFTLINTTTTLNTPVVILNQSPALNNGNSNVLVRNSVTGAIELNTTISGGSTDTNLFSLDLTLPATRSHDLSTRNFSLNNGGTLAFGAVNINLLSTGTLNLDSPSYNFTTLPQTDNTLVQFLAIDILTGEWKIKDESALTSAGIGAADQLVPTGVALRTFSTTDATTNLDFQNFNNFTITLGTTHTLTVGTTIVRTDAAGFNINTAGNDRFTLTNAATTIDTPSVILSQVPTLNNGNLQVVVRNSTTGLLEINTSLGPTGTDTSLFSTNLTLPASRVHNLASRDFSMNSGGTLTFGAVNINILSTGILTLDAPSYILTTLPTVDNTQTNILGITPTGGIVLQDKNLLGNNISKDSLTWAINTTQDGGGFELIFQKFGKFQISGATTNLSSIWLDSSNTILHTAGPAGARSTQQLAPALSFIECVGTDTSRVEITPARVRLNSTNSDYRLGDSAGGNLPPIGTGVILGINEATNQVVRLSNTVSAATTRQDNIKLNVSISGGVTLVVAIDSFLDTGGLLTASASGITPTIDMFVDVTVSISFNVSSFRDGVISIKQGATVLTSNDYSLGAGNWTMTLRFMGNVLASNGNIVGTVSNAGSSGSYDILHYELHARN